MMDYLKVLDLIFELLLLVVVVLLLLLLHVVEMVHQLDVEYVVID
jgi:hypothetical protein